MNYKIQFTHSQMKMPTSLTLPSTTLESTSSILRNGKTKGEIGLPPKHSPPKDTNTMLKSNPKININMLLIDWDTLNSWVLLWTVS